MSIPLFGRGGFRGRTELAPLVPVPHTDRQRALTHMAASILLEYPTTENLAKYPVVAGALDDLPRQIATRLRVFLDHAEQAGPDALAQQYVTTFDLKRKCTLYLSYFLTGDTRKRGMALVSFLAAYKACGFELEANELPDYLPVLLEFSAVGDAKVAGVLLSAHREGLEVLREALTSIDSPWAEVVAAVICTLPRVNATTRKRVLDLIAGGPPMEMVGLDAMGPLEPQVVAATAVGKDER